MQTSSTLLPSTWLKVVKGDKKNASTCFGKCNWKGIIPQKCWVLGFGIVNSQKTYSSLEDFGRGCQTPPPAPKMKPSLIHLCIPFLSGAPLLRKILTLFLSVKTITDGWKRIQVKCRSHRQRFQTNFLPCGWIKSGLVFKCQFNISKLFNIALWQRYLDPDHVTN